MKVLERFFSWLSERAAEAISTGIVRGVERGIEAVAADHLVSGQAALTEESAELTPGRRSRAAGTNNQPRRGRRTAKAGN